jgi:hypothetical protein
MRRVVVIVATIAAIIIVPVGIVGGIDWLDLVGSWSGAGRPVTDWLTSGEVRATTQDGTLVKVRVSFDVPDSETKGTVQRNLRDVTALIELSVASLSTEELTSEGGIERLSKEMRRQVNGYLAKAGVRPLRRVAIQDLWYKRP